MMVGAVADRGHDRRIGRYEGARHDLFVERETIFVGTAAPHKRDRVGAPPIGFRDRLGYRNRCQRTLYWGSEQAHTHRGRLFAHDPQEVARPFGLGRRDQSDSERIPRQPAFARRIEQALGLELAFDALVDGGEFAGAPEDDGGNRQLHQTAVDVNADASVRVDLGAVVEFGQVADILRAHEAGQGRTTWFFQREVDISGAGLAEVRDLASHADVEQPLVLADQPAYVVEQLANTPQTGPRAARRVHRSAVRVAP